MGSGKSFTKVPRSFELKRPITIGTPTGGGGNTPGGGGDDNVDENPLE